MKYLLHKSKNLDILLWYERFLPNALKESTVIERKHWRSKRSTSQANYIFAVVTRQNFAFTALQEEISEISKLVSQENQYPSL